MKNLHFALRGMLIQATFVAAVFAAFAVFTALFSLYSCSIGEDNEGQTIIEDTEEDESEVKEKSPVTPNEDGEPSDKNPPDKSPPDEDSDDDQEDDHEDNPAEKDPTEDDPIEEDPPDDNPPDDEASDKDPPEEEIIDDDDDDPFSLEMPSILINEVYTEYDSSKPRIEFIELKALTSGNLEGLKVFIASNTKNPLVYEFKSLQVKKREYIVLHMRAFDDTYIDEYGDDLNESAGKNSLPDVRDFWVFQTTELLRTSDAVYITDRDDNILDAVMFAEKTIKPGVVSPFFAAAEYLFSKGAWMSPNGTLPGQEDAIINSTASTRSISRDETMPDTNTAADWYITATNGITMGKKNSTK